MNQWKDLASERLQKQNFDYLSFAIIDFEKDKFEGFDLWRDGELTFRPVYDLASLTKPLTLSFSALMQPKVFATQERVALLNHCAGLPSGGRLSKNNWKETLLSYSPRPSQDVLYSDYSALRLMLEIEDATNQSLYSIASSWWDEEVMHWKKIDQPFHCPPTGSRAGELIQGKVHDDNAYVIGQELSHAGLFGSLNGVCRTLLQLKNSWPELLKCTQNLAPTQRFVLGFDRVVDPKTTLAGSGSSEQTLGHLGFTGTSFWIDLQKKKGWVLLTNATQRYWYSREQLQALRRELGSLVWASS